MYKLVRLASHKGMFCVSVPTSDPFRRETEDSRFRLHGHNPPSACAVVHEQDENVSNWIAGKGIAASDGAGVIAAAGAEAAVATAAPALAPTAPAAMMAFHASAAAWSCVAATAAELACAQDACVSDGALHGLSSRWQMKPAITPMLSADPWLKSFWFAAIKAAVLRPSMPLPNTMLASEQLPRSRAARSATRDVATRRRASRRRRFLRLLAAWHAVFCWSHCPTPPESWPAFAAFAHALCWTSHERPRAALTPTNVSPLTEKGRSPAEEMTGGGAPPSVPVNFWTFVPVAAVPLSDGYYCVSEGPNARTWWR